MRALIRELLFPGRCLLCGQWMPVAGRGRSPVCPGCREGLSPLRGPRCRICSTPLVSELGICTRCRVAEYAFSANHSIFAYEGPVKVLISRYKFSGRTSVAFLLAELLGEAIREHFPGIPVVPVPPRPGRARQDSLRRISRLLSRRHGCLIVPVLKRAGGATQKSLDFERRRTNLEGRIRILPGAAVSRPVLLLDDIFTTGATADACSRVLRQSGCPDVKVITIAMEV